MDDQLDGIGRLGREYVVDHLWEIVSREPKIKRKGAGLSCSGKATCSYS
jgi:hypothetical protein